MQVEVKLSLNELQQIIRILNRTRYLLSNENLVSFNNQELEGTKLFIEIDEIFNKLCNELPNKETLKKLSLITGGN